MGVDRSAHGSDHGERPLWHPPVPRTRGAGRPSVGCGRTGGRVLAGVASPVGSLEASPSVFVTTGAKVALDRLDREGFVALGSLGASGARRARRTGPPQSARSCSVPMVPGLGCRDARMRAGGHCGGRDGVRLHTCPDDEGRPAAPRGGLGPAERRQPSDRDPRPGHHRASAWGGSPGVIGSGAPISDRKRRSTGDGTGYEKWNLGLHATDFALGRFSLRLSAGAAGRQGGTGQRPLCGPHDLDALVGVRRTGAARANSP